jgi:hypothetical protein
MHNVFLLLTPVLAFGVLTIVRFIGCDAVYGLHHVTTIGPPENFVAKPGNQKVDLSWEAVDEAEGYRVHRGLASNDYTTKFDVPASQTTFTDTPLPNGVPEFYVVAAVQDGDDGPPSVELQVTPGQTFVASETLGTPRSDFTGAVGMAIRVAADPLTIRGLGRFVVAGNGGTHVVKIADGTSGVDLPGAAVTISLSGATPNQFAYEVLAAPVLLNPNTEYYVVSQETMGGDQWLDLDTTVVTSSVASVVSAAFTDGVNPFVRGGGPGHTYGPVDFLF